MPLKIFTILEGAGKVILLYWQGFPKCLHLVQHTQASTSRPRLTFNYLSVTLEKITTGCRKKKKKQNKWVFTPQLLNERPAFMLKFIERFPNRGLVQVSNKCCLKQVSRVRWSNGPQMGLLWSQSKFPLDVTLSRLHKPLKLYQTVQHSNKTHLKEC